LATLFEINKSSLKPECIACIEAKQSEKPFRQTTNRQTKPGKMTHMDLWGKYKIASINRSYYYLLMVDNTSQHTTLSFLKLKDQAVQQVKGSLAYLTTRNRAPQAIRINYRTEFTNTDLKSWCAYKGINIQMTTLYSPSQNRVNSFGKLLSNTQHTSETAHTQVQLIKPHTRYGRA
jgi:Integrase core domain